MRIRTKLLVAALATVTTVGALAVIVAKGNESSGLLFAGATQNQYSVTIDENNRPVQYGDDSFYFKLGDRDNYGRIRTSTTNCLSTDPADLSGDYEHYAFAWKNLDAYYFSIYTSTIDSTATIGGQVTALRGFPDAYRIEINYTGTVNGHPNGWDKVETGPVDGVSTRIYTRNGGEIYTIFALSNGSTQNYLYVKSMTIYYNC